ncbi:trypsin 7 [Culex quinquefasciatus]|uniref:trypsin n=1 Tax=Culex quinquefasciatus TaxID=7176 RepID=B0WBW0_CULQU|nr:trypsin 5G1 [Culex quinquefasciatus]EDS42890.1 trypsin 7 [Culex quinquefasciatus]|eukprot:XP_001846194.1 trypsin 7 [Culex quinquefasciatus]
MFRLFALLSIICFVKSVQVYDPLRPWWNAPSHTNHRIVGGFPIDIRDAPYQVSLNYYREHWCGGSLIGSRWVLTAGHCVDVSDLPLIKVRVGSTHHESGGQLVEIQRVLQHPLYDLAPFDYDFALLELDEAVQLGEEFYAVELPGRDEPVEDGQMLQVSGWGDTQNAEECDDVLRATNVPTVNQEECRRAYSGIHEITDRMICAGFQAGGMDACQGDSGGPLVAGRTVVGVVSWGKGCAQPGYPGVYGRVAAVRDWIEESTGI